MSEPLTKSYVNTHDPEHPVQEDLVLYQLFEKARKEGHDGELVNLETMKRMTASQIHHKADGYAKGLLALGLTPGEDILTVVGVPTLEAACLFTAAVSVGIGYAHPYLYHPADSAMTKVLPVLNSKVIIVGEGTSGSIFNALASIFSTSQDFPTSPELPDVKHIFYDNSYKDRSPTQKFINNLDKLRQHGKSISDHQLEKARKSVKPEDVLYHIFSSGSTGKPKCIVHQHKGMANALCLVSSNLGAVFALNYSFDDLIGYSSVSMLLAGKYKKVVLSPQIFEESGADEFGDRCSECLHPEGIEHFILPSGITQLIASSFERKHAEAPLLKLVLCSGQIISRRFKEYIIKTFSGLPLTKYGLSEVMVVAGTTLGTLPSDMEQMLDARIYPIPNLEVRLVDENDVVVDVGKDGEIQLKTFNVFKNYRGDPERTEAAFTKDGFFKTGDMGMMYPDGTFIIKGRAADAIRFKIFGDVVYPGPIEEVVSTYPGIKNVSASIICVRINFGFVNVLRL